MKYTFHIVDVFRTISDVLKNNRLIAEAAREAGIASLRQSFNPEFYAGYLASGAIIFVLVLGTSRLVAARDLSTAGASGSRK